MKAKISQIAISFPFRIDEFGKVATTTSEEKIWADRVRSVVATTVGERVFRADFGTIISSQMFESAEIVEETIRSEISRAFSKYLSALTLSDVFITFDDRQTLLEVDVQYTLPTGEESSTVIGIASLNNNDPIREDLL